MIEAATTQVNGCPHHSRALRPRSGSLAVFRQLPTPIPRILPGGFSGGCRLNEVKCLPWVRAILILFKIRAKAVRLQRSPNIGAPMYLVSCLGAWPATLDIGHRQDIDCVVVGAGVVGLATARRVAQAGLEVIVMKPPKISAPQRHRKQRGHPCRNLLPCGKSDGASSASGQKGALFLLR